MLRSIRRFFAPEPHIPRLPDEVVKRKYPRMRWRVLEATFVGYALYYFVRNNIPIVASQMEASLGYTKEMLGFIMSVTAISYGLGKFFMGAISDRSNPRVFIAVGLLLSSIINFAFGGMRDIDFNLGSLAIHIESYHVHLFLWGMNGLVQGMGWPPCGRSMGHWYSESERGLTFSIWNTSHNVGAAVGGWLAGEAVVRLGGWEYAFFVPGVITAVMSIYLILRLVDTPQSQGLPPIEEYRGDYTPEEKEQGLHERELTYKELFLDNVLMNKYVWILAVANFFAYITRYAMLDWGPTYLKEVKNTEIDESSFAVIAIELGGIPSTIALGYLSDRLGGRRGMVAVLCMLPIILAYGLFPFVPTDWIVKPFGSEIRMGLMIDLFLLFIVGLFIYPVINFITIMALDLTSKKAIGVAAGFIGLFGYVGKAANSWWAGKAVDQYTPTMGMEAAWNIPLWTAMCAGIIAALCLLLTWNQRPKA